MAVSLVSVKIEKDEGTQLIIGHAGFIKTAEDLYEAMIASVPGIKFGLAFAEASGQCLVRGEGNDESLRKQAENNAMSIAAGHTFVILFKNAFPINLINAIKTVQEVSEVFCATANPVEVIVGVSDSGRAVLGVVDGSPAKGVESDSDKNERRNTVRKFGYKL
jgi:adenosine/AMP kinase